MHEEADKPAASSSSLSPLFHSHIICTIWPLQPETISIIRNRGTPVREKSLYAHLLSEHIKHFKQLAVSMRCVLDAGIVIVFIGLDIRERAGPLESPRDDVQACGFGGDSVCGWYDALVIRPSFG